MPFGGPARLGAPLDALQWRGDSWSQALLFGHRSNEVPEIREYFWTRSEDTGRQALDARGGSWMAVRSVDMGGCSSPLPYVVGDGTGFAE